MGFRVNCILLEFWAEEGRCQVKFCALCATGIEKLVKDELKALGAQGIHSVPGKVFYEGDGSLLYRSNLQLRCAEGVLLVVGEFPAGDFDQLFDGVKALAWETWIPPGTPVVLEKVRTYKSALTSLPTIQSMSQKAVYQALGSAHRPQAHKNPIPLRVYLEHDRALVCINTSGESLHKRGYRRMTSGAPLKETLAAALLMFSGWRRKYPLMDPFCGSGTILMEALLFGFNIPPGLHRKFAFEDLQLFDPLDWKLIQDEAREKMVFDYPLKLYGSDKDPNVIHSAKANAQAWGFESHLDFQVRSMEETRAPEPDGFLITNPPYGERLETQAQAETLMRQLRGWEKRFPGYRVGIISPLPQVDVLLNRTPFMKRPLHNGPLEVHYWQFNPEASK